MIWLAVALYLLGMYQMLDHLDDEPMSMHTLIAVLIFWPFIVFGVVLCNVYRKP